MTCRRRARRARDVAGRVAACDGGSPPRRRYRPTRRSSWSRRRAALWPRDVARAGCGSMAMPPSATVAPGLRPAPATAPDARRAAPSPRSRRSRTSSALRDQLERSCDSARPASTRTRPRLDVRAGDRRRRTAASRSDGAAGRDRSDDPRASCRSPSPTRSSTGMPTRIGVDDGRLPRSRSLVRERDDGPAGAGARAAWRGLAWPCASGRRCSPDAST